MNRRALVAAGALALAGCGKKSTPGGVSSKVDRGTQVQGDIEVIQAALDMEVRLVAHYDAAGSRGAELAGAERAHVRRLHEALTDLGGEPSDRAVSASEGAFASLSADLENTAIALYVDLLPKLAHKDLRELFASIVADEAAHLAMVEDLAGREPVPEAFVVGKKLA